MFNSISRSRAALALLCTVGLSACSENNSTVSVDPNGATKVAMGLPSFLNIRAIDPEALRLSVTLNGTALAMVKDGDVWTGSGQVAQNDTASLTIEWNEAMPNNANLLLARYNDVSTDVNAPVVFDVRAGDYETEGDAYDADLDMISNLNERRQDSDPFDPLDPIDPGSEDVPPRVKVSAVRQTPVIDGSFEGNIWAFGQFQDVDDDELRIDNLVVDEVGGNASESVNYGWAAMHDGRFLSIFVFGRVTNSDNPPTFDSGLEYWEDDSLELFFDGNLSQDNDDYDQEDDLHIMIPLSINDDGEFADNNSNLAVDVRRIARGVNVKDAVVFDVLDPEIVEFATCICFGQQSTWEVRIDMVAAKIPVGKTFGFEIQLNVDDDGGRRDTKWAWGGRGRVPGDTNEDTDIAWRYPSAFSQIRLLPFGGG